MRKAISFIFLLFSMAVLFSQNSLSVKDVKAGVGSKAKIILALKNSDPVTGVQFSLKLPKGLIVNEKLTTLSSRKSNHLIMPSKGRNGEYLFLAFSSSNTAFKGNSGNLIEIPIEIPINFKEGQIFDMQLSKVILTSTANQNIGSNHKNGKLTIIKGDHPDLIVSDVKVAESKIEPSSKVTVNWLVKNKGKVDAFGGWTERVYLISEKSKREYFLGGVTYSKELKRNGSLSRSKTFNINSIIGFDGAVKLKVVLEPNQAVKEPLTDRGNNTAFTVSTVNLLKKLFVSVNKQELLKNSEQKIRLELKRSGDYSKKEEVTITTKDLKNFALPQTIYFEKGESSRFLFVGVLPNNTYQGDKDIIFNVTSKNYAAQQVKFKLLEDKKLTLSLSYPKKESSKIGDKIKFTLTSDFPVLKDEKITIGASNVKRIDFPKQVVLKSGEKSTSFEVVVLDTKEIEKSKEVLIKASANNFIAATETILLSSINIPSFKLSFSPNQVSESEGYKATRAVLKRTSQLDKRVLVVFSSDKKEQLILPKTIVFEKGEESKIFNVGVVDNDIVEGEREVQVLSQVQFESCNCVDNSDASTKTLQKIKIIDNDGLALKVKASPSTIKAGVSGNSLTISRNIEDSSILSKPVTVQLSTDNQNIISLPKQVVIPANKKEVKLTFDTKIDYNSTGDQNVRIIAQANNYAKGFAWVLISDQNKPDAIITNVALSEKLVAGSKVTATIAIKNQGNSVFNKGSKISYYLSKNNLISSDKPFASSILTKAIKEGETLTVSDKIKLPSKAGKHNLIVSVNREGSLAELDYQNNQFVKPVMLQPTFNVTLNVDKKVYKTGEKVTITGKAISSKTASVSNEVVELKIKNGDFTRSFKVTTNADGSFVYSFEPLGNESGLYEVSASYPGVNLKPQKTFNILGFEIVNKPSYIKWEPFVNFTLEKEFVLQNKTTVDLTDVKLVVKDNQGHQINIQQTPINIKPKGKGSLKFKILTDKVTLEQSYQEIKIELQSKEGAVLKEIVYYHSREKDAHLISKPSSIETTMAKGKTRLYEFSIRNNGDVVAKDVEIRIPHTDWIVLKSEKSIKEIPSGGEIKVVLELKPTAKQQINVPITGQIAVNLSNSKSLLVPFKIETVSETTGKLVVDATDEYTYNTESGKHLSGAKVQVKHPFTGKIVAEGITDDDGRFVIPKINEGWYSVSITADKHDSYQNNIQVDPGKTNYVKAFLSIKAITYSWEVVKDEITDEYKVKLVTKFETNVPKPVITMELDNSKLDLKEGESRMVNMKVTNHGLIQANKVKLSVGKYEGYEINLLIESIDVLNAKSSVVVPILLKNIKKTQGRVVLGKNGGCGGSNVTLEAYYPCDKDEKIFSFTTFVSNSCGGTSPIGSISWPLGSGGPGYPGCSGSCDGWTWNWEGSSSSSSISEIDLCDPCVKSIIKTVLKCLPQTTFVKVLYCAFSGLTSADFGELTDCTLKTVKRVKCLKFIPETIWTCIKGPLGFRILNKSEKGKWDYIADDFNMIEKSREAMINKISEYIDNSNLENDEENLVLFINKVAEFIDNEIIFDEQSVNELKAEFKSKNVSISDVYVDQFTSRWNTTLEAWKKGILSPNDEYPNIVDKVKVLEYKKVANDLASYVVKRGFVSVTEMYKNAVSEVQNYVEEKKKEGSGSACASVSIEFEQKLSMTREAFKGTLKVNNSSSKAIKDIELDLVVKDANGENKTNLFQINKEAFLNGAGVVKPGASGKGLVTFIPTKKAAPTVKQSYSFGGVFSYFDEELQEKVSQVLNPVTLEVTPSPDLVLNYFMQRDIIGDDALTEGKVEPSIPAELSLMISNDGYGEAKRVQVESMQPKIIDNEKGLLIDFKMIGSNFNNQDKQLGLLNVDFGNIAPKTTSVGQWWFTSSLMGHFVEYDINVKHLNSYGNKDLSLIKSAQVHELIKSVTNYGDQADAIDDFLVNDVADAKDTPDAIYYSKTGLNEEVFKADKVTTTGVVSRANLTSKVTINPKSTGWNYGNVSDPAKDLYKIDKVIRDKDQKVMPTKNFWQTFVTLKDGLEPKYESTLHVLDKISEIQTYTVYYKSLQDNLPEVVLIEGVNQQNTDAPVTSLKVVFNKPINEKTFILNNIQVTRQGEIIASKDLSIQKVDDKTFTVNLKKVTNQSGFYTVTVSSVGVKDTQGNEGANAKRVEWLQFLGELGILKFKSDQLNTKPINSVQVTFNKEIRGEEFTLNKVLVNNKQVSDVVISKIDQYNYMLSGLDYLNAKDGSYELQIDLPKITAVSGEKGLAKQKFTWKVDQNTPKVVEAIQLKQGAINSQHITEIDVKLNRKLSNEFKPDFIKFKKDNRIVNVPVVVTKIDDLTYNLSGFAPYTDKNGTYDVYIDQTKLEDENSNFGKDVYNTTWSVAVKSFEGLTNISLSSDKGMSKTDNITSGDDIALNYQTLQDNLVVEVYEMLANTAVLIDKSARKTKGLYTIKLSDKKGAKRFKLVAQDKQGNRSKPKFLDTYIDFTPVQFKLSTIKERQGLCYDFDVINVKLSEAIDGLPKEAILFKSSGVVVPVKGIKIDKVSELEYKISNIVYTKDSKLTIVIDKSKTFKKVSGLQGKATQELLIGVPNNYQVTISGDQEPIYSQTYTYEVSGNYSKLDWVVVNGEIISKDEKSVVIKWLNTGEQNLFLKYHTPLGCSASKIYVVNVKKDENLGLNKSLKTLGKTSIGPVPNNGEFYLHTNKVMQDCSIKVYNLLGDVVYSDEHVTVKDTIQKISLPNVSSGVYIFTLTNAEENITIKFVVE